MPIVEMTIVIVIIVIIMVMVMVMVIVIVIIIAIAMLIIIAIVMVIVIIIAVVIVIVMVMVIVIIIAIAEVTGARFMETDWSPQEDGYNHTNIRQSALNQHLVTLSSDIKRIINISYSWGAHPMVTETFT